jgi:NAD-dependent SIR2 family protein deacetylase
MNLADAIDLLRGRHIVALTGAGVSTESGIPDYRSPEARGARSAERAEHLGDREKDTPRANDEKVRRPIHGPDFVRSEKLRQRYWARAVVGWEQFRLARPGAAHLAIAELEERGLVRGVITQNVDRLHHRAGSRDIIELHGALAEVVCLDCGVLEDRDSVQRRMRERNPSWLDGPSPMAPDGDAELSDDLVARFVPATCVRCDGALKPNVVFFGHNVAKPIVDEAYARVDQAEALLIAGTSLAVFSGYRFLLRAAERRTPIVIVNRGPVRGEERATLKLEASTGEALSELARLLRNERPHGGSKAEVVSP